MRLHTHALALTSNKKTANENEQRITATALIHASNEWFQELLVSLFHLKCVCVCTAVHVDLFCLLIITVWMRLLDLFCSLLIWFFFCCFNSLPPFFHVNLWLFDLILLLDILFARELCERKNIVARNSPIQLIPRVRVKNDCEKNRNDILTLAELRTKNSLYENIY